MQQVVTAARLVEVVGHVGRQVGASRRRPAPGRGPSRRRRPRCGTTARRRRGRRRRRPRGRRRRRDTRPSAWSVRSEKKVSKRTRKRARSSRMALQHQLLAAGRRSARPAPRGRGPRRRRRSRSPTSSRTAAAIVGDVVAVVPVLGDLGRPARRAARSARPPSAPKSAHLAPVVVDVVLARDGVPGEGEDPRRASRRRPRCGRGRRGAVRWGWPRRTRAARPWARPAEPAP